MPPAIVLFLAVALSVGTPELGFAQAPGPVAAGAYRIDPTLSFLVAATGFLGQGNNLRVRFPIREGSVDYEPTVPDRTRIALSVDARSMQGNAAVVRAAGAALEPDRFPLIGFLARELDLRQGSAEVTGDLSLHGVTRPVRFTISSDKAVDGDGVRLRGRGRIRRSDFGLPGSAPFASDTVELRFDVTFRPS
jgi:polyisoprenoid-binding protein YceI